MVGIAVNPNAQSIAVPVTLRARVTTDRDAFTRQYRGVEIGSLPDLHVPTGARYIKDFALWAAKKFIADMAKKGRNALQEPEQFKLYGPYQSRGFGRKSLTQHKAQGWHEFEYPYEETADFVVEGRFLATSGKVIETV